MFDQNMINQMWANAGANVPTARGGKPVNPKKGSKNQSTASSLISEAGGTGGALGGAAIGTMILPGIGTLVGAGLGGLLGGTSGRLVENQVRDGEYRLGDALEEGAISGVLGAGPGSLLKVAKGGAAVAKGGAPSLEAALVEQASREPLKTSLRGRIQSKGNEALLAQYGTIGKNVARKTNPTQTVGSLADIGIIKPQDAERIANAVTGGNGIINQRVVSAVQGAGNVPLNTVMTTLDDSIKNIGLTPADAKSVKSIVESQMGRLAQDSSPNNVLNVMKALEKRAANLQGKGGNYALPTPERIDKAEALLRVRDDLQNSLYDVAGANKNLKNVLTPEFREELLALSPKNKQWQSFVDDKVMKVSDVGSLRSTMSPFVGIRQIIDEADTNAMTFGGRVGDAFGKQGGLVTRITNKALDSPTSQRFQGQALRAVGGVGGASELPKSALQGSKGITTRMGLVGGGGALAEAGNATKLGAGAYGASNRETQGMGGDMSLEQALMGGAEADVMGASTGMPGMESEMAGSPYSKENLLMDIQRDPKNAEKYIEYYQQLDEIFGATGGGMANLSQSSKNAMASSDNAINTVDQLQSLYANAGNGSGRIGGTLKGLAGKAGFDESAKVYDNLSQASVTQIAKALAGSGSGTVSDMDAKVIIAALPTLRDNPNEARQKFAALRQRLETARNNTMMYGAGGGGDTLEGALMNQGAY